MNENLSLHKRSLLDNDTPFVYKLFLPRHFINRAEYFAIQNIIYLGRIYLAFVLGKIMAFLSARSFFPQTYIFFPHLHFFWKLVLFSKRIHCIYIYFFLSYFLSLSSFRLIFGSCRQVLYFYSQS